MSKTVVPEFAIGRPSGKLASASANGAREDRILGLRDKLEYFYKEMKLQAQQRAKDLAAEDAKVVKHLLELIGIADSFDDVFRMCEDSNKMRKQTLVRDAFATTYEALIELLESNNVFRVDILGKKYDEVTFRGVAIPEPWQVVEFQGPRIVRRVVRALWVRVVNNKLYVLRRAQVSY